MVRLHYLDHTDDVRLDTDGQRLSWGDLEPGLVLPAHPDPDATTTGMMENPRFAARTPSGASLLITRLPRNDAEQLFLAEPGSHERHVAATEVAFLASHESVRTVGWSPDGAFRLDQLAP